MLERKDLVKGQYYRYWYGRDYYHIGKCLISNTTNAIGIWGNTIDLEKFNSFTMDGRFGASSSYELATKEEIEWLDYCIEKGKFIPKKEVKSNSLIGRYVKCLRNN